MYYDKNSISFKVAVNLLVLLGDSVLTIKLWGFHHSAPKLFVRYSHNDTAFMVLALALVCVALIPLGDG